MRLKGLIELRAEKQAAMETILAKTEIEKRALNEDETAEFDKLEKEIQDIDSTIEREERARKIDTKTTKVETEDRAVAEEKAFTAFILNKEQELRAGEIQLTQGNNGSIVPTTIANRIITSVRDMVPFLTLADVTNTNGKLSVPVYGEDSTNHISADYVDEGEETKDNIGKFTTVDLTGYVLSALALISNKLKDNTDINVVDFVVSQVARAIAEKLEKEFVNGTEGKITGILSSNKGITAVSSIAVTYDELVSLKHSIKQRYRKNARWIMAPETYTAICKLKDSNGLPYFKEEDYKILNIPVIETDSMPTMEAGNKAIVFGDLKGYSIKAAKTVEINILREKFATKNMLGVLAFAEYDAKITDSKLISVLTMKAGG